LSLQGEKYRSAKKRVKERVLRYYEQTQKVDNFLS